MTYAQRTRVGVDQTKTEIERTLMRYGASRFAYYSENGRAAIVFEAYNRRLRFDLPLPSGDSEKEKQLCRARWRALLLCIKAKLESVESKIGRCSRTRQTENLSLPCLPQGIRSLEGGARDDRSVTNRGNCRGDSGKRSFLFSRAASKADA